MMTEDKLHHKFHNQCSELYETVFQDKYAEIQDYDTMHNEADSPLEKLLCVFQDHHAWKNAEYQKPYLPFCKGSAS